MKDIALTQAEKLEALIARAIESGWDVFGSESQSVDIEEVRIINGELQPDLAVDKPGIYIRVHRHHGTYSVNDLLFNNDFARALFGEKTLEALYREDTDEYLKVAKLITWVSGYEYDYEAKVFEIVLQGAVISKDPIDYMYEVVFKGIPTINGIPLDTSEGREEEKRVSGEK